MLDQDNIKMLVFKYLQDCLSGEEKKKLDEWLEDKNNKAIFSRLIDKHRIMEKMERLGEYDWQKSWNRLERKLPGRRKLAWRYWVAAASIVSAVILSTWMFVEHSKPSKPLVVRGKIEPGKTCAELVLPGGQVIGLHRDSTCVFLSENGNSLKSENGVLAFPNDTIVGRQKEDYNEIRTPKGGEYQVILPDGSVVWLNAESKLRFPTVFSKEERRVWASGELYFQVARDTMAPFRVEVEGAYEVEVLGTEFNVRAYRDLPLATTLVKGSVAIHDADLNIRLRPGEQVLKKENAKGLVVHKVDVTPYIAWREGYFLFENERLENILNELARWYNVDIFFENQTVREERFSVDIQRHEDFEEVLRLIERTGTVKITIKENRVFVK